MNVAKVTVSIESSLLKKIDRLVKAKVFPNRSRAIQDAVLEKIERFDQNRLARECEKLDMTEEQAMADEGLASEVAEWQTY
jgi:metal-responsive CopG/Arc/MetJ family transcriptional regulator